MDRRIYSAALAGLLLLSQQIFASPESLEYAVGQLEGVYLNKGGDPKAIKQLRCFIKKHGHKKFIPKPIDDLYKRCNLRPTIAVENERGVVIIDYTKLSIYPRLYQFDFAKSQVAALHTAHGRYGETERDNTLFSNVPKRNSIKKIAHYSNVEGSNATAGGFYLTGIEYQGAYKRSLVLHGLERDVNDNSCMRATVFHRSSYISDSSTNLMSSGCPMVAMHRIDPLIDLMKEGALVYLYTPTEAALAEDNCDRNLWEEG